MRSTQPRFGPLRPLDWPRQRLLWVSLPALFLVLAGAIVISETGFHPPFQHFDVGWYHLMLDSRVPWLNDVHQVLDFVGSQGATMYCIALFLTLLVRRHWRLAVFTAVVNLSSLGVTHLIKFLVARPRPENVLVNVDSNAYPSGHSSGTVTAMLVTAVVVGRTWIWVSGAILSVAMMYSRTYLGAHWLSDTVAGALLGVGLTLLLWAVVPSKYSLSRPATKHIVAHHMPAQSKPGR